MTDEIRQVSVRYICPTCDLIAYGGEVNIGEKATCNRCGTIVYTRKKNTIARSNAISLAGLTLLLPAATMPIVGVDKLGFFNESSVIDCIDIMLQRHFYLEAFCVFLFILVIPCIRLMCVFSITHIIKKAEPNRYVINIFRLYHQFSVWTMLHVFLLGLVVAMYKIDDLATLSIGFGLVALVLLLICSTLISVTLDEHEIWHMIEQINNE